MILTSGLSYHPCWIIQNTFFDKTNYNKNKKVKKVKKVKQQRQGKQQETQEQQEQEKQQGLQGHQEQQGQQGQQGYHGNDTNDIMVSVFRIGWSPTALGLQQFLLPSGEVHKER